MPYKDPVVGKAAKRAYCKANRAKEDARVRAWRKQNPERHKAIAKRSKMKDPDRHIRDRYRMRSADYDAAVAAQDGRCAICREIPTGKGHMSKLRVDHCHAMKAFRALLCWRCNTGLGMFRDSPNLLTSAAWYLDKHRRRQRTA